MFGDGQTWNETVCDNMDDGTHNETQKYVQNVCPTKTRFVIETQDLTFRFTMTFTLPHG